MATAGEAHAEFGTAGIGLRGFESRRLRADENEMA